MFKVETFMDFGGLPTQEGFSSFQAFLAEKKNAGEVIFTAAHQNMGFDRYESKPAIHCYIKI